MRGLFHFFVSFFLKNCSIRYFKNGRGVIFYSHASLCLLKNSACLNFLAVGLADFLADVADFLTDVADFLADLSAEFRL